MNAARPPPRRARGPVAWARTNLFATPFDAALTLLILWGLYAFASEAGGWLLFDAVIDADSRAACAARAGGACWAVIAARFDQFAFGFYPASERWRPVLAFVLLVPALAPVLARKLPCRRPLLAFSCLYPFLAGWLIHGGPGLPEVETKLYGGFLLTLVIGVTGIAASLPLGIALALGRRSRLPALRLLSAGFVEFARGVPLIALLFVASTMLNYFLPPGTSFDLLVRVLIMVSLFAAAYIAEVVRGGLQSVPRGQEEAAAALGLTRRQTLQYVVLPQALRVSIPGIVNVFIGLFKDSTLVIVIGLLDPLGIARAADADPKWNGLATELYLFVALFFFVCCFAMSRYSMRLERRLAAGAGRR
jgi:general L-amino acid transport system permease protein